MQFRRLWTLDILSPVLNEERVFSSLRIPGRLEVQRRWALDLTSHEYAELLRLASRTSPLSPAPMVTFLDHALVTGISTLVASDSTSTDDQRLISANGACLAEERNITRCK